MAKRILWTVNGLLPEVAKKLGVTPPEKGAWIFSLFTQLKELYGSEVEFHLVTCAKAAKQSMHVEMDATTHFHILPMRKNAFSRCYDTELDLLEKLIRQIDPCLVHVHGTEDFYGLVTERIEVPVIISLQGVRNEIIKYLFSDISKTDYYKIALRYRDYGMIKNLKVWKRKTDDENKIIRMNRYFIGRTLFDKGACLGINPQAEYLTGEDHRLLRPEFYAADWQLEESEPYSIHTTISESSFKGVFLIINALEVLARKYPQIKLNIAGTFNGPIAKSLAATIKKKGLTPHIHFLGGCNAGQLVASMHKSRVFLMGSYIDNSPNSLQEAQAVGIPPVAAFTGGIPSLVDDFENGLLYPRGDLYYMVHLISELFDNPELARRISANAKKLKTTRNNPERLKELYKTVYARFIENPTTSRL